MLAGMLVYTVLKFGVDWINIGWNIANPVGLGGAQGEKSGTPVVVLWMGPQSADVGIPNVLIITSEGEVWNISLENDKMEGSFARASYLAKFNAVFSKY